MEKIDVIDKSTQAMAEYAQEVVGRRAIPDYRDGLKPVQRLLLWTAHQHKLSHTARHMKLAKLSGLVLGFHPHGSGSVSEAAVNLAQPWKQRMPLIDIHGNLGSIDGSGHAADRYIEARQAPGAFLLTDDLNKNSVDFVSNYDNTDIQPEIMPARLPMAIINGASGIAYGMATEILPHNPIEIAELLKLEYKGQLDDLDKVKSVYHGPDLPTGNEIVSGSQLDDFLNQQVSFKLRVRSHIENNCIVIDEAPYFNPDTTRMIESIIPIADKISEITSIDNEKDDFPDIRIVVKCKKGTSAERLEAIRALIEKRSTMSGSVTASNLMIVEGKPVQLSVKEVIQHFAKFRIATLKNIWNAEIEQARSSLELVESEIIIAENLDTLKQILETAADKNELINQLMSAFTMTERQAVHVAAMAIHSLLKSDMTRVNNLMSKRDQLIESIDHFTHLVTDGAIKGAIDDVNATIKFIKKHKRHDRLTVFASDDHIVDRSVVKKLTDNVPHLKRYVSINKVGPIVKSSTTPETGKDWTVIECYTDDYVGLVTASGLMAVRQVIDIDSSPVRMNREIPEITADDRFIGGFTFEEGGSLVTFSGLGYMKRMPHSKIMPATKTKRYMKKAHVVSGLKKGTDKLIDLQSVADASEHQWVITFDRRRKPEVTIDLGELVDRCDAGGASGARKVNTHDGNDRVISIRKENKNAAA